MKNVAKTIGFTAFTKKKLLWLLNGAPPNHRSAATATFFRKTYKTTSKIDTFCLEIKKPHKKQWKINIFDPKMAPIFSCPEAIYDIGTEILYFQCFVTADMFLFCKPIIFSGNCRIFRDLAFGSVKTRFKAILKTRLTFFMNFCPRRETKLQI